MLFITKDVIASFIFGIAAGLFLYRLIIMLTIDIDPTECELCAYFTKCKDQKKARREKKKH